MRGTAGQFAAVLGAHGFTHGLLVAAAPYGGDNGHILDAIKGSEGQFKGIAVLRDAEVPDDSLDHLAAHGIVGLRVNLSLGLGELEAPGFARVTRRMRVLGWFLQVHSVGDELAAGAALLDRAGVPLMFDHFARPDPAHGLEQPGCQALLRFGRRGGNVVKISGPFRAGRSRTWTSGWTSGRPFLAWRDGCPTRATAAGCCGTTRPACSAFRRCRNGPESARDTRSVA